MEYLLGKTTDKKERAYQMCIRDRKLVGSKAVFKGNLIVHALYECPEGKLHSFEAVSYTHLSRPVTKFDEKLWTLLDDMAETLADANGVGLAAPQVGILRRVVVIDVGDEIVELINPEIMETSGEQDGMEGCLSVPGEYWMVKRPNHVKARAQEMCIRDRHEAPTGNARQHPLRTGQPHLRGRRAGAC